MLILYLQYRSFILYSILYLITCFSQSNHSSSSVESLVKKCHLHLTYSIASSLDGESLRDSRDEESLGNSNDGSLGDEYKSWLLFSSNKSSKDEGFKFGLFFTVYPAVEKTRSTEAELAGIDSSVHASLCNRGYSLLCSNHLCELQMRIKNQEKYQI